MIARPPQNNYYYYDLNDHEISVVTPSSADLAHVYRLIIDRDPDSYSSRLFISQYSGPLT